MSKPTRICTIEGCTRKLRARGMCPTHYRRWQVHGDPLKGAATVLAEICKVEGCETKPTRRDMCTKHYQRWRRYGDPTVYRPDATKGCSIEGCERKHYGRGWCSLHYTRWSKTGDPLGVRPHFSPLAGKTGDLNPAWVGDDAGYEAVHRRLTVQRGRADEHECVHCGGGAEEWAYTHEDPEEKVSPIGLSFSIDIFNFYIPLCSKCHRRFDIGRNSAGEH